MHSFGDWLRQIKGDTGKKKKVQQPDSVSCMLGVWVEGEDCLKKKKKGKKETVSTYILIKAELNKDVKSLFYSDF